jgi:hypothetical protein
MVKKKKYRWDEFDQSAPYANCKYHNRTPMLTIFLRNRVATKQGSVLKNKFALSRFK